MDANTFQRCSAGNRQNRTSKAVGTSSQSFSPLSTACRLDDPTSSTLAYNSNCGVSEECRSHGPYEETSTKRNCTVCTPSFASTGKRKVLLNWNPCEAVCVKKVAFTPSLSRTSFAGRLQPHTAHKLDMLPSDVLVVICSYLPANSIVMSVALVNTLLNLVVAEEALWKQLFRRDFSSRITCSNTPWRNLYRYRANQTFIQRYSNEPQAVIDRYLEMEMALDCLRDEKVKHREESISCNQETSSIATLVNAWVERNPTKPRPSFDWDSSRGAHIYHDCVASKCPIDVLKPSELLICKTTGLVHLCSRRQLCVRAIQCDLEIGAFVCPMTGRVTTTNTQFCEQRRARSVYKQDTSFPDS